MKRLRLAYYTRPASSFLMSMATSHQLLTTWLAETRAQLAAKPRKDADPDLESWYAAQKQKVHDKEGGVAGLEEFADKYASTRGDH
jgi:hypothetical protein